MKMGIERELGGRIEERHIPIGREKVAVSLYIHFWIKGT